MEANNLPVAINSPSIVLLSKIVSFATPWPHLSTCLSHTSGLGWFILPDLAWPRPMRE